MYTGDQLIYGVQLTIEDAIKYILKYIKKNNVEVYNKININLLLDSNNSKSEKYYEIYKYVNELKLSLILEKVPCCDYEEEGILSFVYLGVCLCENSITYRGRLKEFVSFEDYNQYFTRGIKKAEKAILENKDKYIEDLNKILPKSKVKPKFYSFANDCSSCT